ncbi:MAG: type VI secretion system Vgr family protein [Desulfovibrio sp.]|jgi:type VI secretion system secreted protein VgrG|nr:type VI secretion system Vgr family protein [Desulfovibrio sp.]
MAYTWTFATSAADQGTDKFRILAFSGEDSLCQGYRFDILLLAESVTGDNAQTFLQSMAGAEMHTLSCSAALNGVNYSFVWNGIPEQVEWLFPLTQGGQILRVLLRPTSYKLRQGVHSRIFLGANVPTLLQNLLVKEGFSLTGAAADASTSKLLQTYRARPISCQYNESSYDFLQRHLERVGGYSYIAQSDNNGQDVLVLADGAATPDALPVKSALDLDPTGSGAGVVTGFVRTVNPGPASVILRDYSTDKPGAEAKTVTPEYAAGSPMNRGAVNYFGMFNMFGEVSLSTGYSAADAQAQAQLMAQARMRASVSRSNRIRGESSVAWMRPGYSITLSGKNYLLLSVNCTGNYCRSNDDVAAVSRAGDLGFTFDLSRADYSNTFTCHPLEAGSYAPELSTRRPVVNGLMHAVITAPAGVGGYASVDGQGRYKVKFPFPEAVYDAGNNEVTGDDGYSAPVRMMQANAGAASGIHFPLRKDAEVLVGFTDGDPDRPFIIGAAPNPGNPSVITDANNKENIIRTGAQHELVMRDNADRQEMELLTGAGHSLLFKDDGDKRVIQLLSSDGENWLKIVEAEK